MQELGVARPALAAHHLSQRNPPGGVDAREGVTIKPMDLSSGGLAALTSLFRSGSCGLEQRTMPVQGSPLVNAQRLAELVRQQHMEREEKEDKRKWEEETEEETQQQAQEQPLHLVRAKWDASQRPSNSPSPNAPGSPGAASSSGSESGREEKRRRLDILLHKKFEAVTTGSSSPPPSHQEPPRRASQGSGRRKQAHPSSSPPPSQEEPASPPALSLRPSSDLFPPPAAASSPRESVRPASPLQPHDLSQRAHSPEDSPPQPDDKEAMRAQLLQVGLPKTSVRQMTNYHIFSDADVVGPLKPGPG